MAYDLAILGSGAAAFAGAVRAADLGARVLLALGGEVGGCCLNHGCIPSKRLLRAGEFRFHAMHSPFPGVRLRADPVDMALLDAGKRALIESLEDSHYRRAIRQRSQITAIEAPGSVTARGVRVGDEEFEVDRILVATGSTPARPDIDGLVATPHLTSDDALDLTVVPEHLVVLGGGIVALEIGQALFHLGARVTLVQRGPRVLRDEEPELAAELARLLAEEGVELRTGTRTLKVEGTPGDIRVTVEHEGTTSRLVGTHLLVATGRTPTTRGLGLEERGVKLSSSGAILTRPTLETDAPGIFAAGDVKGKLMLVTTAAKEGVIAVENALLGRERELDPDRIPRAVFTSPELAAVGLTEAQAVAAGHSVETRIVPMSRVARAQVNGDPRGMCKLVTEEGTGHVLGVHLLCAEASEIIHTGAFILAGGLTREEVGDSVFVYPSLAEVIRLTAQAFDSDVDHLSECGE